MLQQTPVARVLPAYPAWMARWPTPQALAAEPAGAAVRQWDRLGYPRRALALHHAAAVIATQHGGSVPRSLPELRALPGVGDYTAAAVASFAFGQAHPVVDTNVRRVLARAVSGRAQPAPTTSAAEMRLAAALVPRGPAAALAPRWAVAVMELGALVCTARAPRCSACPIRSCCAWQAAGRPAYGGPTRRTQGWAGTDRYVRGLMLAELRTAEEPLPEQRLRSVWSDAGQARRALAGLLRDGLAVRSTTGDVTLP